MSWKSTLVGRSFFALVVAVCVHPCRAAPPILAIAGSEDNPGRSEENRYLIAAMKAAGHPDGTYLEFEGRTHGRKEKPGSRGFTRPMRNNEVFATFDRTMRRCLVCPRADDRR